MTTSTQYNRPLAARRSGTCGACGDLIEVGDPITRSLQRGLGYVHAACLNRQPSEPVERREAPAELQPGVYETDGVVYIVKPNRERTKTYAKRVVEIGGTRSTEAGTFVAVEFEYAPGAIYRISPEDRITGDRAKALTLRYGKCICCGRDLKAGESVEQGIGPVCVKLFPELEAERAEIKARARAEAKAAKNEFAAAAEILAGTADLPIADLDDEPEPTVEDEVPEARYFSVLLAVADPSFAATVRYDTIRAFSEADAVDAAVARASADLGAYDWQTERVEVER